MPRKPNYGYERAERTRIKAAKKAARLKAKQDRAAGKEAQPEPAESEAPGDKPWARSG